MWKTFYPREGVVKFQEHNKPDPGRPKAGGEPEQAEAGKMGTKPGTPCFLTC